MSKSIKLKNNTFIDSTGVTHKRKLLSDVLTIPEGIKMSEETLNRTNQYLKLFSVDTKNMAYKSYGIYFVLMDAQSAGRYNSIFELTLYKDTNTTGIKLLRLAEKIRGGTAINTPEKNIVGNLYAVKESTSIVSVFYKPLTIYETPKLQILSFQKYGYETLTIANPETYLDALPATAQTCVSDNNVECGLINFPEGQANTVRSVTINFKKGFRVPPVVTVSAQTSEPGVSFLGLGVREITTTSAKIFMKRTDGYGTTVNWIAVEPES